MLIYPQILQDSSFVEHIASSMAMLTQQQPTEGGAAMSTRFKLTCGCGFCSWQAPPGLSGCWEDIQVAGSSGRRKQGACSRDPSASQGWKSLIQSKGSVRQYMSWLYISCCIYSVCSVTYSTYTCIYPFFASHCLNRDLSNSYSSISCFVYGICIHADSSIWNFPKGMKTKLNM
jgi:hypothetical protein